MAPEHRHDAGVRIGGVSAVGSRGSRRHHDGQRHARDYFNAWFGRTLVPAERTELDGPFYNRFFDTFGKSPFEPADFGLQGNITFPRDDDTTGGSAGQFGRDDGVVFGAL